MPVTQKIKVFLLIIASFFFSGLKSMLGVMAVANEEVEASVYQHSQNNEKIVITDLQPTTLVDLMSQLKDFRQLYAMDEIKNFIFSVDENGQLVIEGRKDQIDFIQDEYEELGDYIQMARNPVMTCI